VRAGRQVSDGRRDPFGTDTLHHNLRGGIRLTLGGQGNSVSAHWSAPRARATFTRLPTDRTPYPRTLRVLRELSDEERPSNVLRRAARQRVQED